MSEEVLNNLSLEYLVSNHQKKKLENSTFFINRKNILAKDKKFYKKRIVNLIKNVLTTEDVQLPNDLKKNLDAMFHKIITHFKEIDKAELIQTEYNTPSIIDFNEDDFNNEAFNNEAFNNEDFNNEDFNNNQTISDEITTELNKEIMMDLSKICMRKRDGNPLDKFITITKCKQEEPVYPQKKKLKLKTQEFKEKGINKKGINKKGINKNAINKKKNININYDEEKSETPAFEE